MNRSINRVTVAGETIAELDFLDDAVAVYERWLDKSDNTAVKIQTLGPLGWLDVEPTIEAIEPIDAAF